MAEPPKVLHTKRKFNEREQAIQDLIAQVAHHSEELESLEDDKEKAVGSTEEEEKTLSGTVKKYSHIAETNTATLIALTQARSKAAAEMQKIEQDLERAAEKSKAAIVKREDFVKLNAKQMGIHDANVQKLQAIAERKQVNKDQLKMYQAKRDKLEEKLARTLKKLNEQLNSSTKSTRTESPRATSNNKDKGSQAPQGQKPATNSSSSSSRIPIEVVRRDQRERTEGARTPLVKKQKQNIDVNPYNTEETQYLSEEEFKAISEYSKKTNICVSMCQGRQCFHARCIMSHDPAYKKQTWFAGDESWIEEGTTYTRRKSWSNPYNTEIIPTFSQEEFQEIREYVTASRQCWDMCLGKPCKYEEKCHFSHHPGYKKQPWFTSDQENWKDNVKYTWRTVRGRRKTE